MAKASKTRGSRLVEPRAIVEIKVAGFKSISDEQGIEIRPLTILAGPNSSGKSSMMQPLLLLKQTLEAPYDPGPLLLNGPNAKFTSTDELLSRVGKEKSLASFQIGMRLNTREGLQIRFRKEHKLRLEIEQIEFSAGSRTITLWPGMNQKEIIESGLTQGRDPSKELQGQYQQGKWGIKQARCFLEPEWVVQESASATSLSKMSVGWKGGNTAAVWEGVIPEVIHLPAWRGNPERTYPVAAVGPTYPGTFDKYTASVILQWTGKNKDAVTALDSDLQILKLTSGISAVQSNAVQIEIRVGRLPDIPPTRPELSVSIADVGIGVSQTLPVLVGLHAAQPGQLVYIEQPETHLHPRAQFAMAQVLASAAKRGVRVVVETHSSLLLLGVQSQVAEGKLAPELVKLHWFRRGDTDGATAVTSADMDEAGRFGAWPEDFDDVTLKAQAHYLDKAEALLAEK